MGRGSDAKRPIGISVRTRGVRIDRAGLRTLICRCLDREGAEAKRGLDVVFCGDRVMRRLNRDYRQKDRTTDVLSFPDPEGIPLPPGVAAPALGEIFVSVPTCQRQADEREIEVGVELVRLLVHGTLHILGYDHETVGDRREMEPRERQLRLWARKAGLGPNLLVIPGKKP